MLRLPRIERGDIMVLIPSLLDARLHVNNGVEYIYLHNALNYRSKNIIWVKQLYIAFRVAEHEHEAPYFMFFYDSRRNGHFLQFKSPTPINPNPTQLPTLILPLHHHPVLLIIFNLSLALIIYLDLYFILPFWWYLKLQLISLYPYETFWRVLVFSPHSWANPIFSSSLRLKAMSFGI